ncbi:MULTISPECIES: GspE/PulE family protein [Pseudoalteromonas]|jgi:MSHA biogenesis protein MshE|uniref:GspE/PulE family protein n=1 Tax=Pseudoalteromonas TaxID=53246 RepID=UPI0003FE5EAE|nr:MULTISPECIES: GspE/PulE family protein [Pseudoalteromonas]MBB1279940.1 Flp pilus assembly complex ATPase component TadA [Pseudoalteromonas sp. SR41-1]MBB1350317.1 Flp pilus assembly complex ATPase component TadA [Pseudoalteromonas sp. SG45-3]MBB1357425.1 Flp pilus assembly complex ATPase component TadA [Pseudoalteromonas sp. SG45-6]MBB1449563.1 Flp pilus assembly complex ATPase component TadA [Pseudoalteromonas sp. SG43-1]|tara:strand:+ start:3367 stop:5094 length:1728 start_codon:yes stop_codon:yes gene_type:complete
MRPSLKMRLGDLLVHEHMITEAQLSEALNVQAATGRKLGSTLITLEFISEPQLLRFLAQQLQVPFLDISQRKISADVSKLLSEVYARRYRALVIEDNGDSVLVGMSDPADLRGLDQLATMLAPKRIDLAVVQESQIMAAFDNVYRRTDEITNFAAQLHEEYQDVEEFDLNSLGDETSDATVVKLLQSIFEDAVQVRASDIHIEPDEGLLRIRQRVDGILQEHTLNQVKIASALVLRLKLMSGLDISEKRLPQDGRFNIKVRSHSIDVRLSTMPVQHGESVVMRLLDQSAGLLSLDETGMPVHILKRVRSIIKRPHGMVLVTGPTGSGKTTTLYGALSELNQQESKIITVEDPVEYRIGRINQVQINNKIGLSFASILRTALRQDPDIIMVGEMRDQETVDIGLRAALTGHLVLSTLHTNDAITSAMRLIDMGAPAYLVASSLRAIIAQRLVRRVCNDCRVPYLPDRQELSWLKYLGEEITDAQFSKGQGCTACNHSGYKGRVGIFELLEMDDAMMDALRVNDTQGFAKAAKNSANFSPLSTMALNYAKQGVTSLDEVFKVAEYIPEIVGDIDATI